MHRNITPANVIVTRERRGETDRFWIVEVIRRCHVNNCGEVLGSLPYLAPEQIEGTTQPDRRSDLYSVGAMLYEHLTGQIAFGANRRLAPVITDSEAEPEPPSQIEPGTLVPSGTQSLCRALARDPAHRYQSAQEFLETRLIGF